MTPNEPPVWFWYLIAAAAAWVFLVFGLRTLHRRMSGKPIFADPPPDASFVERWRSGRSDRSLLARFTNANGCLMVAVTREALIVRAHFPFVILIPSSSGLDLELPRSAIREVKIESSFLTGRTVAVAYAESGGKAVSLRLKLKDPEAFKKALGR